MKSIPCAAAALPADGFEVLDACHREMLANLDRLDVLIVGLDGGAPDERQQDEMRDIIDFYTGTARVHNSDEERHVFPVLRNSDDAQLVREVDLLSEDHAWIELHWLDVQAQLEAGLSGLRTFSPAVLRAAADPFLAISREHIAAEEQLLYPQARARMQPRQRRSMTRELATHAVRPPR